MSTLSQVEPRDIMQSEPTDVPPNRSAVLRLGVLVLAVVAAYASTPFNFWVADDYNYIVPKSIDRVVAFFDPTVPSRAFYRPLNWTSWSIDYALWGKSPFGWHLSSILFHTVTTIVVACIAYRLLNDWWPALLSGALFALQPAHTETVSWIGGRADLMAGLFYFPAVLFFVMFLQKRQWAVGSGQWDDQQPAAGRQSPVIGHRSLLYALALLCAVGALLGKEMGVTVPVALVLTDLFLYPPPRWRSQNVRYWLGRLVPHIPFFGIVAIYALMRYYLVAAHIVTTVYGGPKLLDPTGLLNAAASNVLLIVGLPNGPSFVPDAPVILKVAIVLAGLAAALLLARWLGRWAIYSLLWLAFTLLPTANLSQLRWLYIPSFGICLLGALIAKRLAEAAKNRTSGQWAVGSGQASATFLRRFRWANPGYIFVTALLLFWGLGTIYQNVLWYESGEEARSILRQIQTFVPDTTQPVTIYFGGAPTYHKAVFLFNTGLAASMAYLYPDRAISLHEIEQPLPDPIIKEALATPPKLGPNPIYLGYRNGTVNPYPSIKALVHAGLKKE